MWANAQRDGRPAEYRWRPLFNAAKFGWRPLLECHVVTLPRCETRWNLQGCPKLPDRSHPLVGLSSPYCGDMCSRYRCLTSFFPIVDMCLSCKDIVRQSCVMVLRWRFFASFMRPVFPATCILNSYIGHIMCRSMVDIQCAPAVIRQGKKEEEEDWKKPQGKSIMCASATQGGHK